MNIAIFVKNSIIQNRLFSFFDSIIINSEDELFRDLSYCELLIFDATIEISILKKIVNKFPELKIFAISSRPNFEEGYKLLKLGICGYSNSFMAKVNLENAIEAIKNGNIWLYPEFIQLLIRDSIQAPSKQQNPILKKLSKKEKQVAKYITKGLSNKEIATNLGITEVTIKSHLRSIYRKTQTKNRLSLALLLK